MSDRIKKISREVLAGENLERNLPWIFNQLISLYDKDAKLKLAMGYYNFYENYREENHFSAHIEYSNQPDKVELEKESNKESHKNRLEEEALLNEVNEIIKDSILGKFSGECLEDSVKHLDNVRNKIINRMNILTGYTDFLQLYEYVLNRIEYRFKKDLEDVNNEAFTAEVLSFIFETKDNMVINDRIKEVIGQLPVRMTKAKYFELLGNSISLYKGGDSSSLDTYIYMLKTSAAIYYTEGMEQVFPELSRLKNDLEKGDYKNLTEEEYIDLSNCLELGVDVIRRKVNFYYGLQEIVNYLYVIILARPYADMVESNSASFDSLAMVGEINRYFEADEKVPLPEKLEEKFQLTEGMQEEYFQDICLLEPIFMDIKSNYTELADSLMLRPIFNTVNMARKLLGSSLFVDLKQNENSNKADEAYLNQAKEKLFSQLAKVFNERSQIYNRAVMANTLNKMPVFFQSYGEIEEYIRQSLEQCHDLAEKIASVQLIKSLYQN
ncbi:hypothetical protein [Anaerocolumna aminovalerica]|uniref:hypothetical protein n=1 Tax=Anaerocolumna aminovalerica TaxID=1527 RepID=UPI000BE30830|nr:hypothetical protein [Anaerocolumna aminovalerica]